MGPNRRCVHLLPPAPIGCFRRASGRFGRFGTHGRGRRACARSVGAAVGTGRACGVCLRPESGGGPEVQELSRTASTKPGVCQNRARMQWAQCSLLRAPDGLWVNVP